MSELLLIDATEELQTLAHALEQAGFVLHAASKAEAARRLLEGEVFAALIVNLSDALDGPALEELLDTPMARRPAVVGIVRRDQVSELDPDLPLDEFISFPALAEEAALRIRRA